MNDLRHWHKPGSEPSELAEPPKCCARAFEEHHDRALSEAVHAERVRVVTTTLERLDAYAEAAGSVIANGEKELMLRVVSACRQAVTRTGCICPQIEVSSYSGGYATVPGYDPQCGIHTTTPADPGATP